jgi:hypothetical protein
MLPVVVVVATLLLILSATTLSKANQIASILQPWVKKSVRVEIWGLPLSEGSFEVESIRAFGAGLLIHLRPAAGGRQSLLKIAQPKSATISQQRIEINHARYVSWAGKKLTPNASAPALLLVSEPV